MDTRQHNEENTPDIKFNIDDFDLENYDFEPITEGLGFNNQNRKKDNIIVQKTESKPTLRKEDFERKVEVKTVPRSVSSQGLSTFYGDSKIEKQAAIKSTAKKESPRKNITAKKLVEAEVEVKLVAWIIDFIVVSTLFVGTIILAAILVSIPLSMNTVESLPGEVFLYLSIIYICFYLFYFTVFDLQKTFGKFVMGIKTVTTNDEEISIKQSFIRSFVGLASLLLLGFPLVLDFQGKLSDTKICTN